MTEEDQVKYQARSHEDHVGPSKIPRKTQRGPSSSSSSSSSNSSKEVASYQEMRRLQKQKFDAIKDKHA
jgi:hypothetical protein